jgi:hypothetical protein
VILSCPSCGGPVDGSLNVEGRNVPRDWTPALCPCGSISVFDYSAGGLREPDVDDWLAWRDDPPLLRAIEQTVRAFRHREENQ